MAPAAASTWPDAFEQPAHARLEHRPSPIDGSSWIRARWIRNWLGPVPHVVARRHADTRRRIRRGPLGHSRAAAIREVRERRASEKQVQLVAKWSVAVHQEIGGMEHSSNSEPFSRGGQAIVPMKPEGEGSDDLSQNPWFANRGIDRDQETISNRLGWRLPRLDSGPIKGLANKGAQRRSQPSAHGIVPVPGAVRLDVRDQDGSILGSNQAITHLNLPKRSGGSTPNTFSNPVPTTYRRPRGLRPAWLHA